jgi:aspartate aminotransferase
MHFSQSVSRISVSSTAAVVQKAAKLKADGVSVVDFGAGEPDFATPDNIKRAAVEALNQNLTKYTPTGGTRELRQALVERHAADFGSNYHPEECLVTPGGKMAIFEAVAAVINEGDEVILPVPYWVSYLDIVHYAGGKAVLLKTDERDNFAVRAQAIERLVTSKTKLIILNSPSNPAGAVIPVREMEQILALAVERNLLLMTDECYCHFLYDGRHPFSLGSSHNRENLIVVGSLSKTYAMTGWRLGYALGPSAVVSAMNKLQSQSTSNPTSIVQKAAVAALKGPQQCVTDMRAEYINLRDHVINGLRSIPQVKCTLPDGAFYAYPNVSAFFGRSGVKSASDLAGKLLREAHVATVPGEGFGTRDHIRVSYATSIAELDRGLERMRKFLAAL